MRGPAPDDGRPAGAVAAAELRARAAALGARRLPVPRGARENQRDERLVAVAEVRDHPVRDEDGRITGPPSSRWWSRRSGHAPGAVAAAGAQRLLWNRLLLYAWPTIDFGPRRGRWSSAASHADGRGLGSRWSAARPIREDGAARDACCVCSTPAAAASWSRSTTRRRSCCSRSTRARADRPRRRHGTCARPSRQAARAEGDRGGDPARRVRRARPQRGRPPRAGRAGSPAPTGRASSSGSSQPHEGAPRGHAPRHPDRRP